MCFCGSKCLVLGLLLTPEGITTDPENASAIANLPLRVTLNEYNRFFKLVHGIIGS